MDEFFKRDFSKLDLSTLEFLRLCCCLLDIQFDEERVIECCFRVFETLAGIKLMGGK